MQSVSMMKLERKVGKQNWIFQNYIIGMFSFKLWFYYYVVWIKWLFYPTLRASVHVSIVWSRVYGLCFLGGMYWIVFFHVLYVWFCVFVVSISHVYSTIIGWWRWVIRFSCLNESQCKCWVKIFINCNYLNETKCCYLSPII